MNSYKGLENFYSNPKKEGVEDGFKKIRHIIYLQKKLGNPIFHKRKKKDISCIQSLIQRKREFLISTRIEMCNEFIQET